MKFWRDPLWWVALVAGCVAASQIALIGRGGVGPLPLTHWLWVAGAAPLLEELVFRGWLQDQAQCTLAKRASLPGWRSHALAIVVASALFATLHVAATGAPFLWLAFFPSVVYGIAFARNGTVLACVILHAAHNASYFASLKWWPG